MTKTTQIFLKWVMIRFAKFEILDFENNRYKRNIKEMISMNISKKINFREHVQKLNNVYTLIFHDSLKQK